MKYLSILIILFCLSCNNYTAFKTDYIIFKEHILSLHRLDSLYEAKAITLNEKNSLEKGENAIYNLKKSLYLKY